MFKNDPTYCTSNTNAENKLKYSWILPKSELNCEMHILGTDKKYLFSFKAKACLSPVQLFFGETRIFYSFFVDNCRGE